MVSARGRSHHRGRQRSFTGEAASLIGSMCSPASGVKARPVGDSIDIMKILLGYSPGRDVLAAEERVQTLTGELEKEELLEKIRCAKAAASWHLTLISQSSSADLQNTWRLLDDNDYTLPATHCWQFTRKVAEELAEESNFEDWASSVWPLDRSSDTWSAMRPAFKDIDLPRSFIMPLTNSAKLKIKDRATRVLFIGAIPGTPSRSNADYPMQYHLVCSMHLHAFRQLIPSLFLVRSTGCASCTRQYLVDGICWHREANGLLFV